MAQIFRPAANTLSRVSLLSLIVLPAVVLMGASSITRASYNTKVDVAPEQPVPFSHEHHVNELGIDCRYCHTSVEKSAFAGIPATQTCMSCHSQIWTNSPLLEPVRQSYQNNTPLKWNRVNKLPEFVYFNHSIHINRGVSCNTCHGALQKMQMTAKGRSFFMSWCLECHRAPEKFIRPRDEVFNLYWKAQTVGEGQMTPEERALLNGQDYARSPKEIEQGRRLVKQYGIKVQQLDDCWVCHR